MDEKENKIFICSLSDQVKEFKEVIEKTRSDNPEAIIDLICHSQGTIITAMLNSKAIRKTILLAPVFDMTLERSL